MKIIKQSHEIKFITPNALQVIEEAARNSHKSEDKITEGSAGRLIKALLNMKPVPHSSVLRFATATVRLITDRGVMAEITRHHHTDFCIESTRYCLYDGEMEFIKPVWYREEDRDRMETKSSVWNFACLQSERCYHNMLMYRAKPEEARQVLNMSLKTDIMMTGNLEAWRSVFIARTHKSAHPQMRALMIPLLKELQSRIPVVFDDINAEEK